MEEPETVVSGQSDDREQGDFWSDVVDSDTVIIEYQADGKLIRPPFTVPEISHLAR